MSDPRISAVASLLQERVPREVSRLLAPPPGQAHADATPSHALPGRNRPGYARCSRRICCRMADYSVSLARQRRGLEPLRQCRHFALARRCAARRVRDVLLPATQRTACPYRSPAPGAGRRSGLPRNIPRRPGVVRRGLARSARPLHGVGQPGGRRRVAPDRAVEQLVAADSGRVDVDVRSVADRCARRRNAPGVHQPVRRADWDAKEHALFFARKPRVGTRKRCTRCISSRTPTTSLTDARADRPRALARAATATPSHPLANFDTAGCRRRARERPDSIRSRRCRCSCSMPAYGIGARHLRHRCRDNARHAGDARRSLPPAARSSSARR